MKSVNHFTYVAGPGLSFKDVKKVTVPDQALSLRTLLSQHTRGIPLEERPGHYFEEEDVPDFSAMDLTEIHEFMSENNNRISRLQNEIKAAEFEAKRLRDEQYNASRESVRKSPKGVIEDSLEDTDSE